MNLDDAKQQIEKLKDYIDLVENYKPTSFEQEVVYEYALDNHVHRVATKLNEKGYRAKGAVGERKLSSNDITTIVNGKPIDELHEIVKKIFNGRKKGKPSAFRY